MLRVAHDDEPVGVSPVNTVDNRCVGLCREHKHRQRSRRQERHKYLFHVRLLSFLMESVRAYGEKLAILSIE